MMRKIILLIVLLIGLSGCTIYQNPPSVIPNIVYASVDINTEPIFYPSVVIVINGTIVDGDVGSVNMSDSDYLQISESGEYGINFTFIGLTNNPAKLKFHGRYQGNIVHNILLFQWNFSALAWERVTADSTDFPSLSIDYTKYFNLLNTDDFMSNGISYVRIHHDSNNVPSHNIYIDELELTQKTLSLDSVGVPMQLQDFSLEVSENVDVNLTTGTLTIMRDGTYSYESSISFSGTANMVIGLNILKNNVTIEKLFERRLGDGGDVGSASGAGMRYFNVGDNITYTMVSDMDNSYVSIITMSNIIIRQGS